jgi:hypothetical protein
MMRTMTGLCAAAAFGIVLPLGAQSNTQSTTAQSGSQSGTATTTAARAAETADRAITMIGCVQRGADGSFMLMNAQAESGVSSTAGVGATGSAVGTSGSVAAGVATPTPPMTFVLKGGELAGHVGHKVQVTGRSDWDAASASMTKSRSSTSTASTGATPSAGAETTAAGTNTAGTTAASPTGTTGSSAATSTAPATSTSTNTAASEANASAPAAASASVPAQAGAPTASNEIDVQSVRMIAANCS